MRLICHNLDAIFFGRNPPKPNHDPQLAQKALTSISYRLDLFLQRVQAENSNPFSTSGDDAPAIADSHSAALLSEFVDFQDTLCDVENGLLPLGLQSTSHNPKNVPEALRRGKATDLNASRISIPSHSLPRMSGEQLLDLLPNEMQTALHENADASFFGAMTSMISDPATDPALLKSHVSASTPEYAQVLHLCHQGQMLHWTRVRDETPVAAQLRNNSTLSTFAVVKNETQDRLISWPRLQNAAGPLPPNPNLACPDSWARLAVDSDDLLAFHLDISDMFHQLPLPPKLEHLFPLTPITVSELPTALQAELCKFFPDLQPSDSVRPFQVTVPMGWNWAVAIANGVSTKILRLAFQAFQSSAKLGKLHTLHGDYTIISKDDVLLEAYIDDVLGVCAGWPPHEVKRLHNTIVDKFSEFGLPRHPRKSLPLNQLATESVEFMGWIWNLPNHRVYPSSRRVCDLQEQVNSIAPDAITVRDLLAIIGKTIWYSLSSRPLLALLNAVFRHNESPSLSAAALPSADELRELTQISTLLPLSCVNLRLPWANIVIATDASLVAGAVVYATIPPLLARDVYIAFIKANPKGNFPPDPLSRYGRLYYDLLEKTVNQLSWTTAYSHIWRREEHINGLEASILASSVQWAASCNLASQNILWLTDSSATLGCLVKGRSSIGRMLARCRKVAAVTIAHDIHPRIVFVPSEINPADDQSRSH